MDAETRRRIEETVVEILKGADMAETTELKVRSMASEKLGVDLSVPELKRFVRGVVESFLLSNEVDHSGGSGSGPEVGEAPVVNSGKELEKAGREEEEEEEEEGRENKRSLGERELDDEGNLVVCRVSLSIEFENRSPYGRIREALGLPSSLSLCIFSHC